MEINRTGAPSGPVIRGFAGAGFRVDGDVHAGGVMLTPESAWSWDAPASVDALDLAMLEPVLAFAPLPEFLLLGTGQGLQQPPRGLVAAIEARGIGVEAMDSRAAARAWGVLRQEQRLIVAALMGLG